MLRRPPRPPLFPYTPLSRSGPRPRLRPPLPPGEMKPRMDRGDRRLPPLREIGEPGPPVLDRPVPDPRLPRRHPHVAAPREAEIGRAHVLNSSHANISYAVFC